MIDYFRGRGYTVDGGGECSEYEGIALISPNGDRWEVNDNGADLKHYNHIEGKDSHDYTLLKEFKNADRAIAFIILQEFKDDKFTKKFNMGVNYIANKMLLTREMIEDLSGLKSDLLKVGQKIHLKGSRKLKKKTMDVVLLKNVEERDSWLVEPLEVKK